MKFNYDTVADAAYIKVNKGKVKKTIEMGSSVVVDIGAKGNILGIEILNFSYQQGKDKIKEMIKSGIPLHITAATPTTA